MTLLELTEPLFQYVCRVNRAVRKGAPPDFPQLRVELQDTFETMRARAGGNPKLATEFQTMELPLVFFVDDMVVHSRLACAGDWDRKRLAFERREVAGDERFFELLDAALRDSSPEATERLLIFYNCLGLGFGGIHRREPELLRRKMMEVTSRVRHMLEADSTARICPEDYQNVDTRDLREPASSRVWLMVVIFAAGAIVALACNLYFFYSAAGDLQESLRIIQQQEDKIGR